MRSLLIVEDDKELAESLATYLHHEGFECEIAHNGQEALSKLERSPQLPEAILVDIMMPIMDGEELIKKLGNESKWLNIPVVVVTGIANPYARNLGHARHIFQKPVDMNSLVAVLRRYCKRSA